MPRLKSQVNIHEAKTHLSKLLEQVESGGEVVIARDGHPIARLVPIAPQPRRRVFGTAKGQIWMSDDFDAPLPDDILKLFYGENDPST